MMKKSDPKPISYHAHNSYQGSSMFIGSKLLAREMVGARYRAVAGKQCEWQTNLGPQPPARPRCDGKITHL
jgi:hypothetical protein